jgi:hypothetical protein
MCAENRLDLCVKSPLLLCSFKDIGMACQTLVKLPSIKCHENSFTSSRTVTCMESWTDRQSELVACRQTDRHDEAQRHVFATFHCKRIKNV